MPQPVFPGFEAPTAEPQSKGRRFTNRQKATLARGYHPVTGVKLAGNGETCGSCFNLRPRPPYVARFYKCALVKATHGPGTDIRKSWPACERWAKP